MFLDHQRLSPFGNLIQSVLANMPLGYDSTLHKRPSDTTVPFTSAPHIGLTCRTPSDTTAPLALRKSAREKTSLGSGALREHARETTSSGEEDLVDQAVCSSAARAHYVENERLGRFERVYPLKGTSGR